jgi:hypothetical protein
MHKGHLRFQDGCDEKTVNKNMGLSGEGRLCDAAPGEELQSHLLSTANQGVRKKSRQPKDARAATCLDKARLAYFSLCRNSSSPSGHGLKAFDRQENFKFPNGAQVLSFIAAGAPLAPTGLSIYACGADAAA